jgi:hypothetical protein
LDLAEHSHQIANLAVRQRVLRLACELEQSGCRAEQSRLRTAERLTNLLAVLCVVAWRVF